MKNKKNNILSTSEIEFTEEEQSISKYVNEFWNCNNPWALVVRLIRWFFVGTFMGTSDAIPGYSGGTTLTLLGVFKRIVIIAKSVFVPEASLTRRKALAFMLPFATGWIVGVFGFAKFTEFLEEIGASVELLMFFSMFILFAIPIFLKGENPDIFHPKKRKGVWLRRFLFVMGFLLILGIALGVKLGSGGVDFGSNKIISNKSWDLNWQKGLKLSGTAFLAGGVSIVPGGSGAIVQLLLNQYKTIHWTIMAHATESASNFAGLCIFAFSTFLGMLMMIFVFNYVLKHLIQNFRALSFGMLIASAAAILIAPNMDIWTNLNKWYHILGMITSPLLGAGAGILINYLINRRVRTNSSTLGYIKNNNNNKERDNE